MRFTNKVALITGGASGIGRATAIRFAREGARVAVFDVDAVGLDRTLEEIKQQGSDGMAGVCDVADIDAVNTNIDRALDRFGTVDILFNNVGVADPFRRGIEDVTLEDFDRVLTVNVRSMFIMSRRAVGIMKEKRSGRIINNASVCAYLPVRGGIAYATSKGAVVSFTKSLAAECCRFGINVNAIAPGAIETPAFRRASEQLYPGNPEKRKLLIELDHPVRRIASAEEVAGVVAFLASTDASFMTATVVHVDGGVTGICNTISQNADELASSLESIRKYSAQRKEK